MNDDYREAEGKELEAVQALLRIATEDAEFKKEVETLIAERAGRILQGPERTAYARRWVAVAQRAEDLGHIVGPASFYWKVYQANLIWEDAWVEHPRFEELSAREDTLRAEHGLTEDEYFAIGEGPPEAQELHAEWERFSHEQLIEVMEELGLEDEARLHREDPVAAGRRTEIGRRQMHGELTMVEQALVLEMSYIMEAERSAGVGAFASATIMVGSAIEALLLARCLSSIDEAAAIARTLPSPPQKPARPRWWGLAHLVDVAAEAGWLPFLGVGNALVDRRALLDVARGHRNLAHPGKTLRQGKPLGASRTHFDYSMAAYRLVAAELSPGFEPSPLMKMSGTGEE